MVAPAKVVPVAFDRTDQGTDPVREWLKSLDPGDRKIVGDDLQTLEFGWPIGMPLCPTIVSHKGLWELRCNLTSGRIARLLFCVASGRLVLLHAFIKKSRSTPDHELRLAAKRMRGEKGA